MGFFKKVFKGIKKVFKKIGKGIKSAVKGIGKFMDKIGIVGQIGLMFIMPGIGELLAQGFNGAAGWMAGYQGVGQSVINGAGKFMLEASKRVGGLYKSITKGVKDVIGQTATNIASSLGVDPTSKTGQFLKKIGVDVVQPGSAEWGDVFKAASDGLTNIGTKSVELVTGAPPPTPTSIEEVLASNIAEGNIASERFRQSQLDLYSQSREANMQSILNEASSLDTIPVDVTKTTFPNQLSSTAADQLRKDTLGSMDSLLADTAPKATIDSLQEVVVTAKKINEPKSLLQRGIDGVTTAISEIPENIGKTFDDLPELARQKIADVPEMALDAGIVKAGQAVGLIDEYADPVVNQYAIAPPNLLGAVDSTSIGISPSTEMVASNFNQNMSQGNLYGDSGLLFDVMTSMEFLQRMQQQGIDVGLGGARAA